MGIPLASTRVVQTVNVFIAMAIMAQLGHTVLAATFLMGTIRTVTLLIFMAPLFALGSILSRQFGAKNYVAIPAVVQQSWITAILLALIPMLFLTFIGPLLILLAQPHEIIHTVVVYFHLLMWAYPLILLGTVFTQFYTAVKKQHWVLIISIASLVINTILCYGLTLGHFGLPKLGVEGAAISSLVTNMLVLLFQLCLTTKLMKPFGSLWQWQLAKLEWVKLNLKIGLPIAVQLGSNMSALFFFGIMIGWLGETAMSAAQISSQYILFVITASFGLSEAATINVGHAHGEKAFERIHRIGIAGILLSLLITLVAGIVFLIFHKPLAGLFIDFHADDAHQIYFLSMWLLCIRTISMFFDGTSQILTGALRGLYDTKFPMVIDVIANWALMVPFAALFAFGFSWGVIGLSCGAGLTRLVNMVALILRWRMKTRLLVL